MSNLFAFLLDRTEQISKIVVPVLKEGKTVVCDRWSYSTFAYQLMGQQIASKYNMEPEFVDWITHEALLKGKRPDFVYYFPEKIGNRQKDNNDIYETQADDFKDRVNKAYEQLEQELQWIRIYPGTCVEETLQFLLLKTFKETFEKE
jgi:dTMP kinase